MKRRVHWTRPAHLDLRQVLDWVEQSSGKEKARAEGRRLLREVALLQTHSRLGSPVGRKSIAGKNVRRLNLTPHFFHYALTEDKVVILRLRHADEDPDQLVQLA